MKKRITKIMCAAIMLQALATPITAHAWGWSSVTSMVSKTALWILKNSEPLACTFFGAMIGEFIWESSYAPKKYNKKDILTKPVPAPLVPPRTYVEEKAPYPLPDEIVNHTQEELPTDADVLIQEEIVSKSVMHDRLMALRKQQAEQTTSHPNTLKGYESFEHFLAESPHQLNQKMLLVTNPAFKNNPQTHNMSQSDGYLLLNAQQLKTHFNEFKVHTDTQMTEAAQHCLNMFNTILQQEKQHKYVLYYGMSQADFLIHYFNTKISNIPQPIVDLNTYAHIMTNLPFQQTEPIIHPQAQNRLQEIINQAEQAHPGVNCIIYQICFDNAEVLNQTSRLYNQQPNIPTSQILDRLKNNPGICMDTKREEYTFTVTWTTHASILTQTQSRNLGPITINPYIFDQESLVKAQNDIDELVLKLSKPRARY